MRGAYAAGYEEDYWAPERIGHLIREQFGVRFGSSGVWLVMKHMGWSSQRVQRLAIQRDEDAIVSWKQAILVLEDEIGFSLASLLKRSWSPRGHAPAIRTSLQHQQRPNLLGALPVSPANRRIPLTTGLYRRNRCSEQVVAFLKQVLKRAAGENILVWDNHPIHERRILQEFLTGRPRVHIYHFPIYALKLNPVELVWAQAGADIANSAPRTLIELFTKVVTATAHTRNSAKRLAACLKGSDLPWK